MTPETNGELADRIDRQFRTKYGDGWVSEGRRSGRVLVCPECRATREEGHGEHCPVRLMLAASQRLREANQ